MRFLCLLIFLTSVFQPVIYAQSELNLSQPDTSIFYFADKIDYTADGDKIILTGKAKLRYKKMNFEAYRIIYDMKANTVLAEGLQDSLELKNRPTITEGTESVSGDRMSYDLETKQGKVSSARTVMKSTRREDDTYFKTDDMVKLDNNDIHGINARITSCDLEEPHYHFRADSIIVTNDNWVFAKSISLYFDEVPVGWFPFVLYKNNKGRNSGFILPSYYYSNAKGNSFKHLGFFWDMSRYTDYTVTMDYYDRYGYLLQQMFRYKKKYVIDGYVSADFTNDHTTHDWRFKGVHNHKISPSMTFNANADYVTRRSLVRDLGETSTDRMANKLYTNGVFNKRWFNTGDNLKIMSSVTQYVDTAIVKYTFPNISYNMSGRKPFTDADAPSFVKKFRYDGSFSGVRYLNVYDDANVFDENSNAAVNLSEKTEFGDLYVGSSQNFRLTDFKSSYYTFSTGEESYDDYNTDSTLTNYGLKTSSFIQYRHKMLKYFNMRESFNYRHDVAFRYYDEDMTVVEGAKSRYTYDLAANIDTKIYGIFQPEIMALRKIRHTISPSAGFTYYPDFSKDSYGYFVTEIDTTFSTVDPDSVISISKTKVDIFAPSLIGGTPSSETMRLNYALNNIFDAKIRKGEQESSMTLFNLNFSGFYNFAADSNKMSVISARFTSNPYSGNLIGSFVRMNTSLNANSTITPYTLDGAKGEYINQNFDFWNKNPFRMEKWDVGYTLEFPVVLRGTLGKKQESVFETAPEESPDGLVQEPDRGDFLNIPYDISGRVHFSEKYDSNDNYIKNFNGSVSARISPTQNWSVEYTATLNFLMPKEITSTVIKVKRDMHCWQGEFEWDLFNKGFKLLINTKSSIFSDLKFDKDTRERRW